MRIYEILIIKRKRFAIGLRRDALSSNAEDAETAKDDVQAAATGCPSTTAGRCTVRQPRTVRRRPHGVSSTPTKATDDD